MDTYTDIARRIARIMVSPETMVGVTQGMVSVPVDLSYLAYGFIDTETRGIRQDEKIRLAFAVKRGILHREKLIKAVAIILNMFEEVMSLSMQKRLYGGTLGSAGGRFGTSAFLAQMVANFIVQSNGLWINVTKTVAPALLLVGGIAERSIYRSLYLRKAAPPIYRALRHSGDLDLLFFLIEPLIQPFIEAIKIRYTQSEENFNQLMEMIDNEITNLEG